MVCKKIKCYNDLKVMSDNYGQYIDFQYRAVFIRPSKTGRIMLSPVTGGRRPPSFVRSISPRLC